MAHTSLVTSISSYTCPSCFSLNAQTWLEMLDLASRKWPSNIPVTCTWAHFCRRKSTNKKGQSLLRDFNYLGLFMVLTKYKENAQEYFRNVSSSSYYSIIQYHIQNVRCPYQLTWAHMYLLYPYIYTQIYYELLLLFISNSKVASNMQLHLSRVICMHIVTWSVVITSDSNTWRLPFI